MTRGTAARSPRSVRLGLRENWRQFSLLVLVNALVGGMVGLERTVVPLVASDEFGLPSGVVASSFVITFGLVKGLTNVASGALADRLDRRSMLVAGWLVGLPVPFLLAYAPTWGLIVAANVLLGVNQGLAWSMTVNMKIDLVGPRQRGLAMGLNEAAGYVGVGATALVTGYVAATSGLRPEPFFVGIAYAVVGLALSVLVVRDTSPHARLEAELTSTRAVTPSDEETPAPREPAPGLRWVLARTSWHDRTLFGASQAGLVNNLNDGVSWTVFPVLFASVGVGLADIGLIKAVYPAVWGVGQLATGALSDRIGRKPLIVWGMVVQAAGHGVIGFGLARPFLSGMVGSVLLGLGTAMVYPALLAAVGDVAHPSWRASAVGVYRLWRDLGYAVGALVAGTVALVLDLVWAVHVAGMLTLASGLVAWRTMHETNVTVDDVAAH